MKRQPISYLAFLLTSLFLTMGLSQVEPPSRLVLEQESTLWIEGTSSIHDWTCTVQHVAGSLEVNDASSETLSVMGVEVTVPVEEIACKNKTMDKKTRAALKAGAHPVIHYALNTAEMTSEVAEGRFELQATGQLTVAGVTRDLVMTITGVRLGEGRYRFTGQTPLLMTDFDVTPPKAMLGTLKTGDRIVVRFDVLASVRDA